MLQVVLTLLAVLVLAGAATRPWRLAWGATRDEQRAAMPGDDVVARPRLQATHAIAIGAPAAAVWPWLVQIGCGRAGWYSYDRLDNGGVPSARHILPEFQSLQVGDMIPAVPNGKVGFPVARLLPGRSLTLGGYMDPKTGRPVDPDVTTAQRYFAAGWTFVVEDAGPGRARLITRLRADYQPVFPNALFTHLLLEPIAWFMERRMLLNIRERVEAQEAQVA